MSIVTRIRGLGAAAAAATLLASASGAVAQEHSFTMTTSWSGGPLMEIGAQAFADNVAAMSDGRIQIEVFPAGTLGEALKVTETVSNGVADMGHTWMGYDWGVDKTTVLFGGYAGSFDTERMLHWLYRAGGAEMQREYRMEKFGVVSMPLFIRTAEVFLHSRKPVKTLAELVARAGLVGDADRPEVRLVAPERGTWLASRLLRSMVMSEVTFPKLMSPMTLLNSFPLMLAITGPPVIASICRP